MDSFDLVLKQAEQYINGHVSDFWAPVAAFTFSGIRLLRPLVRDYLERRANRSAAKIDTNLTYESIQHIVLDRLLENEKNFEAERATWRTEKAQLQAECEAQEKTIADLRKQSPTPSDKGSST